MRYVSALLPFLFASMLALGQPTKALVDSQNYVFQAQFAEPLRGATHYLTPDYYTIRVTKQKITCNLPYFGRAYIAPTDPTADALQFTTKKFSYKLTPSRKGGWTVLIKPKDDDEIQQVQINISSDGYASLEVVSTNRDPISFNGVVTATPRATAAVTYPPQQSSRHRGGDLSTKVILPPPQQSYFNLF